MGLRLPLFPYFVGRGPFRKDRKSPENHRIEAKLAELEEYLACVDVRRVAVNVFPIDGVTGWVRPVLFEPDYGSLPGLKALVSDVRQHGTIVIPNITHIIGRKDNNERPNEMLKDLMEQIHDQDVEVLSLSFKLRERISDDREKRRSDRYKEYRHDLYEEFVKPRKADSEFFLLASRMARATVEYLNRNAGCGDRPKRRELKARSKILQPSKKTLGRPASNPVS